MPMRTVNINWNPDQKALNCMTFGDEFIGYYLYFGAVMTFLDKDPDLATAELTGRRIRSDEKPVAFKFHNSITLCQGLFHLRIAIPASAPLSIMVWVVNEDIALLLGLEEISGYPLILDFAKMIFSSKDGVGKTKGLKTWSCFYGVEKA